MKQFKQFLFSALALLATTLMGISCLDDINQQVKPNDGQVKLIPFTVNASQQAANTRATLEWGGRQLFEQTDKLHVWGEGIDGTLDLIDGGGDSDAVFQGELAYTGSDPEPASGLKLYARLVSKDDQIGTGTFTGGIAPSTSEAVKQFSTLTAESTYGAKYFELSQGTAFIEFSIFFDPAPTNGNYPAVLTNNETQVANTNVRIKNGEATFTAALPGSLSLVKAMVSLNSVDFKFGGTGNTLEAAKIYKVEKACVNDVATPLTLQAVLDGTTRITINNPLLKTIYFMKNSNVATLTERSEAVITIDITKGDRIQLYGKNQSYARTEPNIPYTGTTEASIAAAQQNYTNIRCSSDCYVYGNMMSLVMPADTPVSSITDPSNYSALTALTGNNTFLGLFTEVEYVKPNPEKDDWFQVNPEYQHILNHPERNIILPATTLTSGCYNAMFCFSGISRVPALPAESLTTMCYGGMFGSCPNIASLPATLLPATTLAAGCYASMFAGCSNLLNTPNLPATTLAEACYHRMFNNCTKLIDGPSALPALTLPDACYYGMFLLCEKLQDIPAVLPATTVGKQSCAAMFEGCSLLSTAPEIRAVNLDEECFSYMFAHCTNLATPPTVLPATTLAKGCYSFMFYINPYDDDNPILRTAPVLPASTLVEECYYHMFDGCKFLNHIECLATDITATNCTIEWTKDVAPTGTFVRDGSMEDWEINSVNGIPIGWTVDPPLTVDDKSTALTMEAVYDGTTITILFPEAVHDRAGFQGIWYSVNGADKVNTSTVEVKTYDSEEKEYNYITTISINAEDKVSFYGDNSTYAYYEEDDYVRAQTANINCSGDCLTYGNVMSLISSTGFATLTSLTGDLALAGIFKKNEHLKNHSTREIVLPAVALTTGCYISMFQGCSGLTRAPELPAITLSIYCYQYMFRRCPGLTSAPDLPATNLVTLCYNGMFLGSPNINYVKCLATNPRNPYGEYSDDYKDWLSAVGTSGTFVKAAGVDWPVGDQGIPTGWTVLEE